MRLGPDLAETQMTQGYYHYWGSLDYDMALEQFRMVQRRQPNNADALLSIGGILRRQGKWEEAVANFERAVELDPRSEVVVSVLGRTYQRMRRYEDAERYSNRLIALNPYNPDVYSRKALLYLRWEGSRERARGVLREASRRIDPEWILVESTILIRIFGEEYAGWPARITTPPVSFLNRESRRNPLHMALSLTNSAWLMLDLAAPKRRSRRRRQRWTCFLYPRMH
jgi:tetratricopeptide (TPR) repeat protein